MLPANTILRELFSAVKTIAIVGAKDDPGQAVEHVGRYLINAGYRILPIHPKRESVWGLPAYKSLKDLTEPVDMVDLFRAAEFCPEHAREVLAMPVAPKAFWMQLGIESPEATSLLEPSGITVVQNACLMVEHRRVMGAK